jgi:hypothetical protein
VGENNIRPLGSEDREKRTGFTIHKSSPTISRTHKRKTPKRSAKTRVPFEGSRLYGKKRCSENYQRPRSGPLFTPFHNTKEVRRLETGDRSKTAQQIPLSSSFQNGDGSVDKETTESFRMGSDTRHERCIFSCPCTQVFPEIPQICYQRCGIPICSNVLRSCLSSLDFHKDTPSICNVSTQTSDFDPSVFRRLANKSKIPRRVTSHAQVRSRASQKTRNSDELGKVRAHTQTTVCTSGSEIRSDSLLGFSNHGGLEQDQSMDQFLQVPQEGVGESLPVLLGNSKSFQLHDSPRQTSSEALPVLPELSVEVAQRPIRKCHSTGRSVLQTVDLVGESSECERGSSTSCTRTGNDGFHRCKYPELGGSPEVSSSLRHLDSGREKAAHKSVRIESNYTNTQALCTYSHEPLRTNNDRQHDSGVLHKKSGRDTLIVPVPDDARIISVVPGKRSEPKGITHSRQTKCSSRHVKSKGSDSANRVVSEPQIVQPNIETLPDNTSRHVRQLSEPSDGNICQPISRRSGLGSGRYVVPVESNNSLCLPPNQPNNTDSEKDSRIRVRSHTSGARLAKSTLVPSTTRSSDRMAHLDTDMEDGTKTATVQRVSLKTGNAKPSRVGVIQQDLLKRGFSEEVALRAAKPQRESSLQVYQSHFKSFCNWCSERDISMESVSIQIVADYLLYMFDDLDRKVATITSHRTALSSALGTFDGYKVGSHPVITNLIKNFWVSRPFSRARNPDWDLLKVLECLIEAPFEPPRFDTIEQKVYTTWKTCFLVMLASTKRASEGAGLSRDERDLVFDKKGVWMRTKPGFLPKTQAPSIDSKPFHIPSHDTFSGRDSRDRLLCPVRMIKFYLHFTNGHKQEGQFFIKCAGEGGILPQTVSAWLKKTIQFAYNSKIKAKGHEVRKTSASWVWASGTQLADVLASGSWSRASTFTSHYLVDVQRQFSGKFRLSPTVCNARRQ